MPGRIIAIHTSDRGNYKSCRRRWYWSSHIHRSLEGYTKASPLWFGSAIHFALENYHGSNEYGHPRIAFDDYVRSSIQMDPDRLPDDWRDLTKLGYGMMDYYILWEQNRQKFETLVIDGIPQVEVQFEIELPIDPAFLERIGAERVVYRGTIDRVAVDPWTGLLWIFEYKTAKAIQTLKFLTDPQVTAYYWACSYIYDTPVAGVMYQQHRKQVPEDPRVLANGRISNDKSQNTTHRKYAEALTALYGAVERAPGSNVATLNALAMQEGEEHDDYIRRDRIYRNEHQVEAEGAKIMLEVYEMLNPDTALYPHAGLHCSYCPFQTPCVNLDEGESWEDDLNDERQFIQRDQESNQWLITRKDHSLIQLAQHPVNPVHRMGRAPLLQPQQALLHLQSQLQQQQ